MTKPETGLFKFIITQSKSSISVWFPPESSLDFISVFVYLLVKPAELTSNQDLRNTLNKNVMLVASYTKYRGILALHRRRLQQAWPLAIRLLDLTITPECAILMLILVVVINILQLADFLFYPLEKPGHKSVSPKSDPCEVGIVSTYAAKHCHISFLVKYDSTGFYCIIDAGIIGNQHAITEEDCPRTQHTFLLSLRNPSFQATGVWTNPNPRPLTSVEAARLKEIQVERDALQARLDALDIEWGALLRIDQLQIKTRYSFGKPPHRGTGKIINLGEFPMEIEDPPHHSPE